MPDSYMNAAAVPVPDAGDDTLRTDLIRVLDSDEWMRRHFGISAHAHDVVDALLPLIREHTEQARADERERIMQVVKALPHGKTNETPWVPDFDAGWRQGRMDVLAALEGAATP